MYKLNNYMEILVDQLFDQTLDGIENMKICRCKKCILDIKALALNSLNPRYIVTDKNSLYVKVKLLEQQFKTDISLSIARAAMIVSRNPRHD